MHHGRCKDTRQITTALALPRLEDQLAALSRIDDDGSNQSRLDTVKGHLQELMDERRFDGVELGNGALAFDSIPTNLRTVPRSACC